MTNRIAIGPETVVALPAPDTLGYAFSADQRVTAKWGDQSRQLPIRVEVDADRVVMAGFSALGTRVMSLAYDGVTLDTRVVPGLDEVPPPEQVLFSMMISLWPLDAWHAPLKGVGWRLEEGEWTRQLYDHSEQLVAEVRFAASQPFDGDITFISYIPEYTIVISTMRHEIFPLNANR